MSSINEWEGYLAPFKEPRLSNKYPLYLSTSNRDSVILHVSGLPGISLLQEK